jgi:hypothetical protein
LLLCKSADVESDVGCTGNFREVEVEANDEGGFIGRTSPERGRLAGVRGIRPWRSGR